jgi:hypothetical protein
LGIGSWLLAVGKVIYLESKNKVLFGDERTGSFLWISLAALALLQRSFEGNTLQRKGRLAKVAVGLGLIS